MLKFTIYRGSTVALYVVVHLPGLLAFGHVIGDAGAHGSAADDYRVRLLHPADDTIAVARKKQYK